MNDQTYVYDFSEGNAEMKALLGGKGAGLAEMTRIGIPVPDGFTVTTAACVETMRAGGTWPADLWAQIEARLDALEARTGRTLGAAERPLLVSVRSGSVFSMPGMMDTILNLGISDDAAAGLADETGNPRFAWDSYRRFLQMYGEVVEGVPSHAFEDELTALKGRRGATADTDLSVEDLQELVATFRQVARTHGADLPTDPREQLRRAVGAVFDSWDNPRARVYRGLNNISDDLGTAVNIQQMVFGNRGDRSATGVAFTRNPSTGVKELYGEFLVNAQGEDVVAGIRTPRPLAELEAVLPEAYGQFLATMDRLESHYGDMQDIEFTIEEGRLFLLQTRNGKRTAAAALKVARDLVEDGVIDRATALRRVEPAQLDQLLHPGLDPAHGATPVTRGLNASPGAAVGQIVFDADTAAERGKNGDAVVLVRWETTPDDIHGLVVAQGVLTAHGGMTSHAAVVARGMGKPCVAGAGEIVIDTRAKTLTIGDLVLAENDVVTLDGSTGAVYAGPLELVPPQITDDFREVLGWADDVRRLGVRANADTGPDAVKARELGAEGIGLCRTEHMFMATDRLPVVQQMILATTAADRQAALDKLLPMQQADFEEIFEAMTGLPVTIRLIDPPLHEFLPDFTEQSLLVQRLEAAGSPDLPAARDLLAHIKRLREFNPMLGTRGVRLSLLYPEICVMQTRAIIRAGLAVAARGLDPHVEIMVPLVGFAEELHRMRSVIVTTADEEVAAAEVALDYSVGTMIELPRAALTADKIAEHADFFSFGTNDLTQTAVGISRDDAEGSFLAAYLEAGIVPANPFASIDADGVAELVRIGVEKGRSVKPGLKTGVCGEHGGDPASIAILDALGLDYVSCSPYRVPLARLAAARTTLSG
ncbi:pyruvate, phosphate dikinase [Xylanimonas cellulosilytica DSM 15894]|uniref:Pyruvate, phosphate dikinase n=1 Tax=Xylanimonas cellulosilytica (strain DSM 15894 / JCM 12276 / CECT 5975 / KCTC 9989 / LMG 20990 / NBRC 107835 / XIL07) TaxID=446471 RepID=D1C0K3_XYLCX|nr:pyruvate, phosphate dikinase [Xylanimonas cellulosilytica]ACZ32206.1 pyruvate, phosphate dikinase [Xylanimonas cellulosilytica DSM 15894]